MDPRPRKPRLDGDLHALYGTSVARDREADRHRGESPVLDRNLDGVTSGSHAADGLVQRPRLVEPGAPEPAQVAARDVVEGVPEVVWLRVLVRPAAAVLTVRAKERVLAHEP